MGNIQLAKIYKNIDINRIFFLSVFSIFFFAYIFLLRNGHSWHDDYILYLKQSDSIIKNDFSDLIQKQMFMQSNSERQMTAYYAPWGFPLIISPIVYLFGFNIYLIKILNIIFLIMSILLLYYLFKQFLNIKEYLIIVILILVSPCFFENKDMAMTEESFIFFSYLGLNYIYKIYFVNYKKANVSFFDFILLGVLVFIPYFIREIGIHILITLLAVQLISIIKNYKVEKKITYKGILLNTIPLIVFSLLYLVQYLIFPHHYLSNLIDISLVPDRISYYFSMGYSYFGFNTKISAIVLVLFLIVFIISSLRLGRKIYFILLYIFLYFLNLQIFFGLQGLRYLLPIIPLVLFITYIGIRDFNLKFNKYRFLNLKNAVLALYFILIIKFTISDINFTLNNRTMIDGPYTDEAKEVFNFIIENTPSDAIIASDFSRTVYFFTDRLSIWNNRIKDLQEFKECYFVYMFEKGKEAHYEPTPESTNLFNYLNSEQGKDQAIRVFNNNSVHIYKILK